MRSRKSAAMKLLTFVYRYYRASPNWHGEFAQKQQATVTAQTPLLIQSIFFIFRHVRSEIAQLEPHFALGRDVFKCLTHHFFHFIQERLSTVLPYPESSPIGNHFTKGNLWDTGYVTEVPR